MKYITLCIASLFIFSLGYADGNKKLLKPDTTKNKETKKIQKPLWMIQDAFTVSTIDDKPLHLLSTNKGFTFDDSQDKVTLLAIWTVECKSCGKWLEELDALQKTFKGKVKVIGLEIGNTQKEKLEKLIKENKADEKAVKKIIDANHAQLKKYAKKHHLSFPIVSVLSNEGNLAFATQALYKFQFDKPRGKNKRGGALPFTVVFGYQGQTAGITAGVSDQEAYKKYIGKLIKHYEKKK
jgi:peroxiredoxin